MKKTQIIYMDPDHIDDDKLRHPAGLLREGATVVFPTETVYGIACDPAVPGAMEKLAAAKGLNKRMNVQRMFMMPPCK